MAALLHELIFESAIDRPEQPALQYKSSLLNYAQLESQLRLFAGSLQTIGIEPSDRVAIYLPKCLENVIAIFGTLAAAAVFVPINPVLKPHQVLHILKDCDAKLLITTCGKYRALVDDLDEAVDLNNLVVIDDCDISEATPGVQHLFSWDGFMHLDQPQGLPQVNGTDLAALLYTSGSTGKPKGVMLSHCNMVVGAKSVAEYLDNRPSDRILVVLPLSFDYGMSQLTTAFLVGATAVLINYLLPREVINTLVKERITGLAAVPPLWNALVELQWPAEIAEHLRYITSSGGVVPVETTQQLRHNLPNTDIYLMYGLTEAFRSTYLPPDQIDRRPTSMGQAIPHVEVKVLRADGKPCDIDEPGELVHLGPLVAQGYWKDDQATRQRFRPIPDSPDQSIAVWSGDIVKQDSEGYLYFIGRADDQIKTSGYRVSPNEIESIFQDTGLLNEVVALGLPHPVLGQTVVLIVAPKVDRGVTEELLINLTKKQLTSYMIPSRIIFRNSMPTNPHGKLDRKLMAQQLMDEVADQ
ncbi:MAG: acyl-CoA ligase (AMP-forming), exosortase A system-associated [Candidatus Thiodiazotropha sp. 'RUGA']|nr:acyl-CoA ligase (AMP-forming), exosortase A system-associated [Candidatus Thiodiazotropha sp. 'RUGA']